MKKLALFLSIFAASFASQVTIGNDSSYNLTAEIIAADGSIAGRMEIQPQHQVKWQSYNQKGTRFSQTPYSVRFTCPNGDEYGTVPYVQPGMYVTARSANGDKSCKPIKKDKQGLQPKEQPQQRQQPQQPRQDVIEEPYSP